MTLANYTKIAQSENAEELIEQLGLEDTFESVWEKPVDDRPGSVSENVLIEETLEAADTEYLFVEGIISNGINRCVYIVLTPDENAE